MGPCRKRTAALSPWQCPSGEGSQTGSDLSDHSGDDGLRTGEVGEKTKKKKRERGKYRASK